MQDIKNLKKKRDVIYPKYIKEANEKCDFHAAQFWQSALTEVYAKIAQHEKNRRKNKKQFKKAN